VLSRYRVSAFQVDDEDLAADPKRG